jgi:carbonic anhydrase
MKKLAILALILLLGLAVGQAGGRVALAADDPHWGYSGEAGPDHWGSLSPSYAACSDGHEQSPVDIPAAAPLNPAGIQFNYASSPLTIFNNGHTIRADYAKGSSITVEGKTYNLLQFHFHAMSEHTLNGQAAPLEVHFVHQAADGELAVVGALIKEGAENAAYASVLAHMPATEGEPETINGSTIDASAMLPADRTYYRYEGSLTTPPCTEGVNWFVLHGGLEFSAAQIAAFTTLFPNDARPTVPLGSRTFLLSAGLGAPVVGMPRTGSPDPDYPATVLLFAALALVGSGLALARRPTPAPVAIRRDDE